MKKLFTAITLFAAVALAVTVFTSGKKADKNTAEFRYDIEYVKTAGDGIVEVRVASYAKTAANAQNQCPKNAVHGVIFKGYAGNGSSQSALSKDPGAEDANADFYKKFFAENGEYMRYVTSVQTSSAEFMKSGHDYKVSEVVLVNKKALRQALENAHVIKGLSSGF